MLTGLVAAAVFTTSAATLASGIHEKLARGEPVRADYLVYGRYIDPVVMVLAALGVAALFANRDAGARRRSVVTVLATFAACGPRGVMLPDDRLPPYEPNIAGVIYLPLTGNDFDIVMWSIVTGWPSLLWSASPGCPAAGRCLRSRCCSAARRSASSMAMEYTTAGSKSCSTSTCRHQARARRRRGGRGRGSSAYQFASMVQEYVLTAQGWNIDFTPLARPSCSSTTQRRPG